MGIFSEREDHFEGIETLSVKEEPPGGCSNALAERPPGVDQVEQLLPLTEG